MNENKIEAFKIVDNARKKRVIPRTHPASL